jgi:hypothetical protein
MNLSEKLAAERRARLAAERLLDLKSRELFEANARLSRHALRLSDQIVESRAEVQEVRHEAEQLKGQQQQTRARLEAAEEQVVRIERRLWDSVESITDGFAVFDRQGRLIAANSAWLAIFDRAERIGPGVPYREVMRLFAEDRAIQTGGLDPADWAATMYLRWHEHPVPEVLLKVWDDRYYRLIDRRARDGDMVCLAQDITTMKRREAELHEARRTAEAATRAKSAFLANMSHELRTPMNGVVAMADMLLETPLDEEQKVFLRTIKSSGEALLAIINDVLDFSKMEAERLVLHPEPFDLERLVHEVLILVAPTVRDKALGIHVDYDLFLPTRLVGDPGRIRQVLTNLVGNAVKFTAEGHVLIRVVGLEREDGDWQIHVTVEDTGIGIARDMLEHIFGSFAQVEDERNRGYEGTGLGLAISRQLIQLMKGEIWVDSEPGRGSCFGFRIVLPSAEPRRSALTPLEPGQVRALLVGGSDLDRAILQRQLGQLGLSTDLCGSGAEVLATLGERPLPQVVLIDSDLPDQPGEELAAALRAAGLRAAMILIAADAGRRAEPGEPIDAVLHRPVLRSELFRTLASLPPPPAPPAPAPSEPPRPIPRPPRAMRVLAAEDNKTNRFVFEKMVKDLDIELRFAVNGHEAVELWQGFDPDIVFMDISMPGMDGKEATAEIRRRESGRRHTPVIAMTAHAMAGDREEILGAGLDHYLTKPLRKAAIVECIAGHCPEGCRPPAPQGAAGSQAAWG